MTDPIPTAEDFTIWLENPVTRFVRAGLVQLAVRQEQVFKDAAWAGNFSPVDHARCTALADANRDLANITYEDALGANETEPTE
jgi:hypothetical protein